MQHAPASQPQIALSASAANDDVALAHGRYRAQRLFGSLDGLRCLCILAVIWHHTAMGWGGLPMSSHGFLGVDLFFVISGFLIVTLLLRERQRHGAISLRRFYMRRTLRIFPAYYAMLAAVTLAVLLKPDLNMADGFFLLLPFYLTYTSNWIHVQATNLAICWSLATEEQFYLIWPAIEKYVQPKVGYSLLASVIIVSQMINFGLLDAWLGRWRGLEIMQVTFTPIALGVGLAHLLHRRRTFAMLHHAAGQRTSVWTYAALLLLAANIPGDLAGMPRLTIHVLMTLGLAAVVMREDHALRPLLTWRPIARLGMLSYGMYLYHMWAMHGAATLLGGHATAHPLAMFALTLALTCLIAEASYIAWERPFLLLKRRFERVPTRQPLPDTRTAPLAA
jgi:peptidoglycan/LPS O-acetylase OafA/YrhL